MNKKNTIILFSIIILFISLLICQYFSKNLTIEGQLDKQINNMSLEEKIGQMLIVYYYSPDCDDTLINSIKNYGLGGIILFQENIINSQQLKTFISDIQYNSNIPMFISVDQEGGIVQRLQPKSDIDVSVIPDMATIGDTKDENNALLVGKTIGQDLKKYGFNMNFAPVIDINNPVTKIMGSRSFGNDPSLVSKFAIAVSSGFIENDIIPVFKHFPGLGDTSTDSHYDLPILNKSKEELYELELKPFIEAINNNADVIMVGHVLVPQLDKSNPASISKAIVSDLLKNELQYKGLVITDALNMGALTNYFSSEEIIINAINAGVDILLMPGSSKSTVETIKEAINSNKIKEEQINSSVKKILELKRKYNILTK